MKTKLAIEDLYDTMEVVFERLDLLLDEIEATRDRVKELHSNANSNTQALRKDFELLLDHLGVELNNIPKQKVIQKKGK